MRWNNSKELVIFARLHCDHSLMRALCDHFFICKNVCSHKYTMFGREKGESE